MTSKDDVQRRDDDSNARSAKRRKPNSILLTVQINIVKSTSGAKVQAWLLPAEIPDCTGFTAAQKELVGLIYDGCWWSESEIYVCFPEDTPEEQATIACIEGLNQCVFPPEELKEINETPNSIEHVLLVCCKGQLLDEPPKDSSELHFQLKHLAVMHKVYPF